MAWNDDPEVRHAGGYGNKFNRPVVVTFSLAHDGSKYHLVSYGKNPKLCKLAKGFADEINRCIQDGTIEPPQVEPAGGIEPMKTSHSIPG